MKAKSSRFYFVTGFSRSFLLAMPPLKPVVLPIDWCEYKLRVFFGKVALRRPSCLEASAADCFVPQDMLRTVTFSTVPFTTFLHWNVMFYIFLLVSWVSFKTLECWYSSLYSKGRADIAHLLSLVENWLVTVHCSAGPDGIHLHQQLSLTILHSTNEKETWFLRARNYFRRKSWKIVSILQQSLLCARVSKKIVNTWLQIILMLPDSAVLRFSKYAANFSRTWNICKHTEDLSQTIISQASFDDESRKRCQYEE